MTTTPVDVMREASAGCDAAIRDREEVPYDSIDRHGTRSTDSLRRIIRFDVALYVACVARTPQKMTAHCILFSK